MAPIHNLAKVFQDYSGMGQIMVLLVLKGDKSKV